MQAQLFSLQNQIKVLQIKIEELEDRVETLEEGKITLPPDVAEQAQSIAAVLPASLNAVAIAAVRDWCEKWREEESALLGGSEE